MKQRLTVIVSLVLCATGCRSVNDSSFDGEAALANGYTFRGLAMNEGIGVRAQTTVDLKRSDGSVLRGRAWGYLDLKGDPGDAALESSDERFSRIDLRAAWERSFTSYAFTGGFDNFNFPNSAATSTTEVFFGVEKIDVTLRPRLALHYDIQNGDDFYARVGLHPRFEIDRALIADVGIDVGYMGGGQAEFYYGVDDGGLSDLLASAQLTYLRDEHFRAFIGIDATSLLSSELEDQNDINGFDDSTIIGFLGCGWSY